MFQIAHLFVDISILSDLPPRSLVQVSARRAAFGANQPEEQLIRLLALPPTHRGRVNGFSRRLGCRRQRQVQLTTVGPIIERVNALVSWVFSGAPGVRRVGAQPGRDAPSGVHQCQSERTRAQRQLQRCSIGSLRNEVIALRTLARYAHACKGFLQFCSHHCRTRFSDPIDFDLSSSTRSNTCGTKVSPHLSPTTPIGCLALFRTAQRALVWVSARPQSMVQARAAQPCPSASYQLPLRFGWESHHHAPHSLCCAPIGCLSRFSANAEVFDGPGKPFRARSTWRASVVVSSYHQIRSAPSGRPGSGSDQRCPCQRAHPRDGAQASTRRTQIFQTTVYRHSSSCPQLETILTATWKGHSALSGIRLVGQNCHRRKMVFHQNRRDSHR